MTEGLSDNVKLQIILENDNNDKVNQTALLNKADMIAKLVDWVILLIDYHDMHIEDIAVKLLKTKIPTGTGRRVNKIITVDSKRSIIQIRNKDTVCLARAIVVGLAVNHKEKLQTTFKNNLTEDEMKEINKGRKGSSLINEGIVSENEKSYLIDGRKIQKILAHALHRICNIPVKETDRLIRLIRSFQDVKLFEEELDIEIQIYNFESKQIYKGNENQIKVYILMSESHFDVISNIAGFTCANEDRNKCKACKNETKCNVEEPGLSCIKCCKYFYGQSCFNNHIKNKKCIKHSYMCKKCHKFYKTADVKLKDHRCDQLKCGNCKEYVNEGHQCYILKKDIKPHSEKYWFFDFESKLDMKCKQHVVNYCVAQDFNGCEETFTNIDDFCKWAFNSKRKNHTFLAHYGKGYDFQFIVEWLVAHGVKPSIIHNGQKIIQLEVKHGYNIRFIDSLSFTLIPLTDFPKTFGLTELTKGHFPHKFNTTENQNYVGPYPDKEYYGYDQMKIADREKFDEWYETTKSKTFDFKQEMYNCCKSDVDILRKGCLKLRKLFIQIANIDPFQYITIASVCHAIYRSEFLLENTIGVCDEAQVDTYSIKSIKWLKFMTENYQINTKHACDGGEQVIIVDGKSLKINGYCEETKTICQFHGCYWHRCNKCYEENTINRFNQHSMKYLYNRTLAIDEFIKRKGYNFITIWEHEFDRNKDIKKITLNEYDLVKPPKIRQDGFHGGRCKPVKLIYDFKNKDVKGKYIDVVSLYPTVMYYDRYPTGHPIKISKPKQYDNNWFGLVYCKVLPSRNLYLPVLPYKQKTKQATKLLFGLCRCCMARIDAKCTHFNTTKDGIKCDSSCKIKACPKCKVARKIRKQNCQECYDERNADCTHSDSQRAITGLWTTAEMQKALKKGYKIIGIYNVWHFKHSSTDLWKGYVRKFLKIKLESSKFTCSEEEYREKARKFGIELGDLKENLGLRQKCKLL